LPLLGKAVDCKEIKVGTEIPKLVVEISFVKMVMYCGATWDFARFHYDPEFVHEFGFTKPVLDPQMHGAFAARMLSDWLMERGRIRKLGLRYGSPCFLGDTITYGGEVTRKHKADNVEYVDCVLKAQNSRGEHPMTGEASLLFHEEGKGGTTSR
jgi:acyl dehydratase